MEPVIQILHQQALDQSRRATKKWLEATAMVRNDGSLFSVHSALELNRKAMEDCRMAVNTMDFIRRYLDNSKSATGDLQEQKDQLDFPGTGP